MLSGIFGKKSDHPLADIKSAQAFLQELPKSDTHKFVMELTEWIESISENNDFKLEYQFEVLCLLDDAVQPHTRKLMREYFTPHELGQFQENRLWMVLSNLLRQISNAYYLVFERYTQDVKGISAIKMQLPLLLARTVNSLNGHLKFICVRYEKVDNVIWANLAKIYEYAEQRQCVDTPVKLYPSMSVSTSVEREAGHMLGWYGSCVNNLQPLYMHLTDRLMTQYCESIDMHAQQGKSDLFSFDLSRSAAPKRVKLDAEESSRKRYVSMADMQPKLEQLINTVRKRVVTEELTLNGLYPAELVCEAAQHLLDFMVAPPVRRSERRSVMINMNVVLGYAKMVEHANPVLNFDMDLSLRWEVEDVSNNGFRTVLPAKGREDVRVGSLLGVWTNGVKNWGVAVVRRMMLDDTNQLHVGAEMLANQTHAVALTKSGSGGGAFEDGQIAMWLYGELGETGGRVKLLMKLDAFAGQCSLICKLNGQDYLLIPEDQSERLFDCDLVNFRAVKQ